jgi:uncharacterized protein (TIGR02452 family)
MDSRDRAWRDVQEMFKVDLPAIRYQMNLIPIPVPEVDTKIEVVRKDSIVAGYGYERPLVLVFADDKAPGGCVHAGAGMQEESIFRRTGIHRRLLPSLYPIGPRECLYCPEVEIVFDVSLDPFEDGHKHASFVACPGIKFPSLVAYETRLNESDAEQLGDKIDMLVELAVEHDHDCLVLGALGCGVWGCPPKHVAEIMVQAVRKSAAARLKNVVFACPGNVYDAFAEAITQVK